MGLGFAVGKLSCSTWWRRSGQAENLGKPDVQHEAETADLRDRMMDAFRRQGLLCRGPERPKGHSRRGDKPPRSCSRPRGGSADRLHSVPTRKRSRVDLSRCPSRLDAVDLWPDRPPAGTLALSSPTGEPPAGHLHFDLGTDASFGCELHRGGHDPKGHCESQPRIVGLVLDRPKRRGPRTRSQNC